MIREALRGLISNAVKFTTREEEALIVLSGVEGDMENTYCIEDNGVGFDMDYAEKLFQACKRLYGQEEFEGTGVGLAMVKRIIERHGGRVWAEGDPGVGASFHFCLPKGGPDA